MDCPTVEDAKHCKRVRNICVLAHVDHGKTTLVDSLIASNGIISQRMAGKLRYMDSRPDEQQRGITMKCSSISLVYKHCKDDESFKNHLVNVIDSPGHVDFFGEVSTALQVCDGCIILVDVIEGICSQTRAAIKQAWLARVKPILILNKIDRLFLERQLTPLDIYIHLSQTLEQVNAFVGELFSAEVLSRISAVAEVNPEVASTNEDLTKKQVFYDWSSGLDDAEDEHLYFSPDNGNVVFASAIDGWGFRIDDFAKYLSKKLGFSENALKKTLWGDFYMNVKEKKILKGAQAKAKKPLFVTMVLENLSRIYEKFSGARDKAEMLKIAESLEVKLHARDLNHTDSNTALYQLFNGWLPLSRAVLKTVCDIVPPPSEINGERIERIMCVNDSKRFEDLPPQTQELKQHLLDCKSLSESAKPPLVVCVSKMFAFEKSNLPQNRNRPLTEEEISQRRQRLREEKAAMENGDGATNGEEFKSDEVAENGDYIKEEDTVFIGFARVFSGTLKRGDWVYVLGPKHDPNRIVAADIERIDSMKPTLADLKHDEHVTRAQVKDLYLLMGRDLEIVEEVSAGHVCGIGGLEEHVIKSAALSSTPYCMPFVDYFSNTIPILRVAIEPQNPSDMPQLTKALRMLNQADACVDVKIQETGEHVIIVTGEVHLERCIVDLKNFLGEDFEFNVSEPIVPFRETIIEPPKFDMMNENFAEQNKAFVADLNQKPTQTDTEKREEKGVRKANLELIEQYTPNKKFLIQIRAKPLPQSVVQTLESNQKVLIKLMQVQRKNVLQNTNTAIGDFGFTQDVKTSIHNLETKLKEQFAEAGWPEDTISKIWSVGPKFSGTNLLMNNIPNFKNQSVFATTSNLEKLENDNRFQFLNSFLNGFQLSTHAGPMCEEPMMGVAFFVEQWKFVGEDNVTESSSDPFGPVTGQIMSTVKESCRKAFQAQPQRLMAAMFSCVIQINADALGKMFAVMGRRHGRILDNDLQEGSQMFTVNAVLPVVESFDFANEIRKQTSGKANPQLAFSHWETIDTDPFWVPTSEEEYTHFGEKADSENRALRYVNAVRRRKGLHVVEKIVEHAEKQRTLAKRK